MKKNLFFSVVFLLGFCFVFSSCGKDDEVTVNESSIIGLWTFVNYTAEIENPTNKEELEYEKSMVGLASVFMQGTTIEFKADKSLIITVIGETKTGSYTKDGNKFTITMNGETTTVDEEDMFSSGSSITIKDGILTIADDYLDDKLRSKGFTKYNVKITFKK